MRRRVAFDNSGDCVHIFASEHEREYMCTCVLRRASIYVHANVHVKTCVNVFTRLRLRERRYKYACEYACVIHSSMCWNVSMLMCVRMCVRMCVYVWTLPVPEYHLRIIDWLFQYMYLLQILRLRGAASFYAASSGFQQRFPPFSIFYGFWLPSPVIFYILKHSKAF